MVQDTRLNVVFRSEVAEFYAGQCTGTQVGKGIVLLALLKASACLGGRQRNPEKATPRAETGHGAQKQSSRGFRENLYMTSLEQWPEMNRSGVVNEKDDEEANRHEET